MSKHLIMLYDMHCVLCTNAVARLKKLHSTADIEYLPLQDEKAKSFLPENYSIEQLYGEIHVIDKISEQIWRGAEAIVYIMTTVPSLRMIAILYHIPGMKPVAAFIYRWIAKHRYQLFGRIDECTSGECRIHRKE